MPLTMAPFVAKRVSLRSPGVDTLGPAHFDLRILYFKTPRRDLYGKGPLRSARPDATPEPTTCHAQTMSCAADRRIPIVAHPSRACGTEEIDRLYSTVFVQPRDAQPGRGADPTCRRSFRRAVATSIRASSNLSESCRLLAACGVSGISLPSTSWSRHGQWRLRMTLLV